jgi:hypothetical protein
LVQPLEKHPSNIHAEIDEERSVRREVRVKRQAEETILPIGTQGLASGEQAGEAEVSVIRRRCQIRDDSELSSPFSDKQSVRLAGWVRRAHGLRKGERTQGILCGVTRCTRQVGRERQRGVGLSNELALSRWKGSTHSQEERNKTAELARHRVDGRHV